MGAIAAAGMDSGCYANARLYATLWRGRRSGNARQSCWQCGRPARCSTVSFAGGSYSARAFRFDFNPGQSAGATLNTHT